MIGKLFQGRARAPSPQPKIFVTRMLMSDLFAIANLLVPLFIDTEELRKPDKWRWPVVECYEH